MRPLDDRAFKAEKYCYDGIVWCLMPYKIVATKGDARFETFRISPTIAVANARVKIHEVWYVEIIDENGLHYQTETFEQLLSFQKSHPAKFYK